MTLTPQERMQMREEAAGLVENVPEGVRLDVGTLTERMIERAGWGALSDEDRRQKIEIMLLILAGATP